MSKEVMKLALEALESMAKTLDEHGEATTFNEDQAMAALREALAEQPAQREPFGYFKAEPFGWTDCAETDDGAIALYTTPQAQRKPLTWEQKVKIVSNAQRNELDEYDLIEATEAAHNIKENQS